MYAKYEQVLLKGTLGHLSYKISINCVSSTKSLTLDTLQIQLSTVSGKVKVWVIR